MHCDFVFRRLRELDGFWVMFVVVLLVVCLWLVFVWCGVVVGLLFYFWCLWFGVLVVDLMICSSVCLL